MKMIKDLPPRIAKMAIEEARRTGRTHLRRSELAMMPLDLAFQFDESSLGEDFWNAVSELENETLEMILGSWEEEHPGFSIQELITIMGKLHGTGS